MAFVGKNWNNVDATNRRPFTYDFRDRLQDGDFIVSVTHELAVVPDGEYRGTDETPSDHLDAETNTTTTTTCWLDTLVENTRYRLTAFVVTSYGVHDDLWAYVKCDPAP